MRTVKNVLLVALTTLIIAACSQKRMVHQDSLPHQGTPTQARIATSEVSAAQGRSAESNPMATLALNTHSASYPMLRERLMKHNDIYARNLQVEEFLNYFPPTNTDAPLKRLGNSPLLARTELAPCLWNPKNAVLLVTMEGTLPYKGVKSANIVVVIDTSPEMEKNGNMELTKQSLLALADSLKNRDTLSIIAFDDNAEVLLPATLGSRKSDIIDTIHAIKSKKSRYSIKPLEEAYSIAQKGFIQNGINRILVVSDGNSPHKNVNYQAMRATAAFNRHKGIGLSVLALPGANGSMLRTLADNGDGSYHYIDSLAEAEKVFQEAAGTSAELVAKDVKAQIEFNPALVEFFAPVGYERRVLSNENYTDEYVDSDDIPAGKRFTMLFEIQLAETNLAVRELRYPRRSNSTKLPNAKGKAGLDVKEELAFLTVQWKDPLTDDSNEVELIIPGTLLNRKFKDASNSFKFYSAVAGFALKSMGRIRTDLTWEAIASIVEATKGNDPGSYRTELAGFCKKAAQIRP